VNLQFRCEFFHFLNHPSFDPPSEPHGDEFRENHEPGEASAQHAPGATADMVTAVVRKKLAFRFFGAYSRTVPDVVFLH
jgi:hypothetical protein